MALNLDRLAFWLFVGAGAVWLTILYGYLPFPQRPIVVFPLAFAFGWYARPLFTKFMGFCYWLAGDR